MLGSGSIFARWTVCYMNWPEHFDEHTGTPILPSNFCAMVLWQFAKWWCCWNTGMLITWPVHCLWIVMNLAYCCEHIHECVFLSLCKDSFRLAIYLCVAKLECCNFLGLCKCDVLSFVVAYFDLFLPLLVTLTTLQGQAHFRQLQKLGPVLLFGLLYLIQFKHCIFVKHLA